MKKILSILLAAVMTATLMGNMFCYADDSGRAIIYVATDGNDSSDGTFSSPLATITAARDKIRELKNSGANYPNGYVVYLRGGTYNMTEAVEFTQEDSGTAEAPIVYRAYGTEKVTLVGGINIPGSKFSKVTDSSVTNKIITTAARDKIYMTDLKTMGITDVGDVFWPGAYSYIKEDTDPKYAVTTAAGVPGSELFVNGNAMTIARYPNEGYLSVGQVVDEGFANGKEDGAPLGAHFKFISDCDRLDSWAKAPADSILMYGFWKYDWADSTVPIHNIDPKTGEIESSESAMFGVKAGANFYVFDLIEELDTPGEYFIDKENCILYMYPPSEISTADVTLSLLENTLITLDNTSNIQIKNIDVTGARKSAFLIKGGENNLISGCEISFTASRAVGISGTNNRIENCYIHDVNGGITLAGGDLTTITPGNNIAFNNHIERFSRITKTYTSAISVTDVGNIAQNNEIHDAPHLAIDYAGVKHQIIYNEIYDVVKSSDDAGAIYGGLDWVGRGHEIKYNYIHDLVSEVQGNEGVGAIYLDGGQCELYMVGNVIENVAGRAFWINGGRDNVMLNNIVVGCREGLYTNEIMLEVLAAGNLQPNHYKRLEEASGYVYTCPWKKAFPKLHAMLSMPDEEKCLPQGNIYANNLHYKTQAMAVMKDGASKYFDLTLNYTGNQDPGFVDAENRDYTIKADAEIFNILPDFKAVPFTRMGRVEERALVRVQDAVAMQLESPYSISAGEVTTIDENNDVVPVLIDGTTFVPLRFLAESIGAKVNFDENTGLITISTDTTSLELKKESVSAKKNGEEITLSKAPIVLNDRTLLPLREISELFDKSVYWHESGLIVVSDDETLFDSENGTDDDILNYLGKHLEIY